MIAGGATTIEWRRSATQLQQDHHLSHYCRLHHFAGSQQIPLHGNVLPLGKDCHSPFANSSKTGLGKTTSRKITQIQAVTCRAKEQPAWGMPMNIKPNIQYDQHLEMPPALCLHRTPLTTIVTSQPPSHSRMHSTSTNTPAQIHGQVLPLRTRQLLGCTARHSHPRRPLLWQLRINIDGILSLEWWHHAQCTKLVL